MVIFSLTHLNFLRNTTTLALLTALSFPVFAMDKEDADLQRALAAVKKFETQEKPQVDEELEKAIQASLADQAADTSKRDQEMLENLVSKYLLAISALESGEIKTGTPLAHDFLEAYEAAPSNLRISPQDKAKFEELKEMFGQSSHYKAYKAIQEGFSLIAEMQQSGFSEIVKDLYRQLQTQYGHSSAFADLSAEYEKTSAPTNGHATNEKAPSLHVPVDQDLMTQDTIVENALLSAYEYLAQGNLEEANKVFQENWLQYNPNIFDANISEKINTLFQVFGTTTVNQLKKEKPVRTFSATLGTLAQAPSKVTPTARPLPNLPQQTTANTETTTTTTTTTTRSVVPPPPPPSVYKKTDWREEALKKGSETQNLDTKGKDSKAYNLGDRLMNLGEAPLASIVNRRETMKDDERETSSVNYEEKETTEQLAQALSEADLAAKIAEYEKIIESKKATLTTTKAQVVGYNRKLQGEVQKLTNDIRQLEQALKPYVSEQKKRTQPEESPTDQATALKTLQDKVALHTPTKSEDDQSSANDSEWTD